MRALVATSILLAAGLVGCPKPGSSVPDGGTDAASADAGAVTATVETPPALAADPPVAEPPALKENVPVTLRGTFQPARPSTDDAPGCADLLVLDAEIHVVDDKGKPATDGRGKDPHPVIGDTKQVCIWAWTKPIQIPAGEHLVVTGTLSTPMAASNPKGILVFDAAVKSAVPPPTPAPAGALPDGDSVVFVRSADATRALELDLAYVYWGDAAQTIATQRKRPLAAGVDYFIVDDSPQLRSATLPATVRPERWQKKAGGGWEGIALDKLAAEAQPFIVRVDKGAIVDLKEMNL